MASTYTSRIRLEKQGDGENPNTWGLRLNQNVIDLLDEAVAAYVTVSVSNTNVTLSANDGTTDQSRSPFIELQGEVTSNLNVTVPSVDKGYIINDSTTRNPAGSTVTLKTATGSGSLVKVGRISQFICDGVSVHPVEGYTSVSDIYAAADNTFTGTNTFSGLTSFTSATSFNTSVSVKDLRITEGRIEDVSVSVASIVHANVTRGIMPFTSLTDAVSITIDFNTGNNFCVTLGGNRTLANQTNGTVGQTGYIYVKQDGTGNRTLTFGNWWKFSGGTAPTLTTDANAVDILVYNIRETEKVDTVFIADFK
jgi:hypothetical protein